MTNKICRIASLILAVSVSASMLTACGSKVNKAVDLSVYLSEISEENISGAISYTNYIENHSDKFKTISGKAQVITDTECVIGDSQVAAFEIYEDGLYRLLLRYDTCL